MYQYIIIKHVNNSFTVFSSTINVFTQDHTMIKYITVTVINQKFDPFIRSTFHVQSRSNLQNYCVAQNLVITYQPISGVVWSMGREHKVRPSSGWAVNKRTFLRPRWCAVLWLWHFCHSAKIKRYSQHLPVLKNKED